MQAAVPPANVVTTSNEEEKPRLHVHMDFLILYLIVATSEYVTVLRREVDISTA